jgi:hypothetical protein
LEAFISFLFLVLFYNLKSSHSFCATLGESGGFILANTSRVLRRFYLSAALVFFAATRAFFIAVAVLWKLVT